ncbi:hypothetical protein BGZ67_009273 [Mortierella alpina]|nr:hypothetical protein BGZ67_009273 [Mortierella alpina]
MRCFLDSIRNPSDDESLLYGKDLSCPEKWRETIMEKILPPAVAYRGPNDLNTLCIEKAAENLMLYIGKEGTRTPLHYDHCGTIGHNLLLQSDSGAYAIWFMIAAKDKAKVELQFRKLNHPLDRENHFASLEQLAQADFPVYVIEQRVGDLILIPSLGYHQVQNMGNTTIKAAWNRLTSQCLSVALNTVLPAYKRTNNPEAYRTKFIINAALEKWTALLESKPESFPLSKMAFCRSFTQLLTLFQSIVYEDWIDLTALKSERWTLLSEDAFDSVSPIRAKDSASISCDFCRCDIWNIYFHCEQCTEAGSSYDICTECFARGRGCPHRASSMILMEYFSMLELQQLFSRAVEAWNASSDVLHCDEYRPVVDDWRDGIVPLARKNYSYTSLAYVRQLQLRATLNKSTCHQCHQSRIQRPYTVLFKCCHLRPINCPSKPTKKGFKGCHFKFCERCLERSYKMIWVDLVIKPKSSELCPSCLGVCVCVKCTEKRPGINQYSPANTLRRRNDQQLVLFNDPSEDQRNRGGIADSMDHSFANSNRKRKQ